MVAVIKCATILVDIGIEWVGVVEAVPPDTGIMVGQPVGWVQSEKRKSVTTTRAKMLPLYASITGLVRLAVPW